MKLVLGNSITDIQMYVEDVPERNEGITSAVQIRAMTKQHMQLAHRVLTGRSERARERVQGPVCRALWPFSPRAALRGLARSDIRHQRNADSQTGGL